MKHNLLPREKKKDLRTEYIARVLNVGLFLLTLAILSGTAALIPAYFKVSTNLSDIKTSFQRESENDEVAEFKVAQAVLEQTAHTVDQLRATLAQPSVAESIGKVLAQRPPGVAITGVSYERPTGLFVLEGIAKTRDTLVAYKHTLEQQQDISNVVSPISNLAKNADLPFQLSFKLVVATSTPQ